MFMVFLLIPLLPARSRHNKVPWGSQRMTVFLVEPLQFASLVYSYAFSICIYQSGDSLLELETEKLDSWNQAAIALIVPFRVNSHQFLLFSTLCESDVQDLIVKVRCQENFDLDELGHN